MAEGTNRRTSARKNIGVPPQRLGFETGAIPKQTRAPSVANSKHSSTSSATHSSTHSSTRSSTRSSASSRQSAKTILTVRSINLSLSRIQEFEEDAYNAFEEKEKEMTELKRKLAEAVKNKAPDCEIQQIKFEILSLKKCQEKQQQMFDNKINLEQQKMSVEQEVIQNNDNNSVVSSLLRVNDWIEQIEPMTRQTNDQPVAPGENNDPEHNPTGQDDPLSTQHNCGVQKCPPLIQSPHSYCQQSLNNSVTRDDLILAFREISLKSQKPPDLPEFNGVDIMQFPSFLSEYERTTAQFEIKPPDNLRRLNYALKGHARSAVQHLLTDPVNITRIIQILKNNYGRVEWVVLTLKDRMRHLPPVKEDDLESFKRFFNEVAGIVGTLKNLKKSHFLYDLDMIVTLAGKLPSLSKSMWSRHKVDLDSNSIETSLETFCDWLERELSAQFVSYDPHSRKTTRSHNRPVLFQAVNTSVCLLCNLDNHPLYKCSTFNQMAIDERREYVRKQNLCFNCLRRGHSSSKCKSENRCTKCRKMHHSILHKDEVSVNVNVEISDDEHEEINSDPETLMEGQVPDSDSGEDSEALPMLLNWKTNNCVLRMTKVKLRGTNGVFTVDALFDEGSTASIIDETLIYEIGADGPVSPITYKWTNDVSRFEPNSKLVNLEVANLHGTKFFPLRQVRTTKNIALPKQTLKVDEILAKYPQFDPEMLRQIQASNPKLLIGSNNAGLIVPLQTVQGHVEGLQATKCRLGWTVHGLIDVSYDNEVFTMLHVSDEDEELTELIKLQFKLESFGFVVEKPRLSLEDEDALVIMNNTLRKIDDRYEIGHLYKKKQFAFPTAASKAVAKKRLEQMEYKMDKNSVFAQKYCEKINDYVTKGYARRLVGDELEEDDHTFYLPHFGVYNVNKPGKFRLVFDAKAKAGGYSLNDLLLKGPDFVPPLVAVLWRARTKPKAFTADATEMFHQVRIRPADINSQRFLFRGMDRNREPDVYVMESMIFGAISSPSCAQFVKNENAKRMEHKYPGVYESIRRQTYVDDYFDNADDNEAALTKINYVRAAQQEGGFQLVKWVTNDPYLTEQIPEEIRAPKSDSPYGHRVLGINWKSEMDAWMYPLTFSKFPKEFLTGEVNITKRFLLKFMMSIFDPLGALVPLVIRLKILFQDVWRESNDWDVPVSQTSQLRFLQWLKEADECRPVRVPRQYFPERIYQRAELVIICDSSDKAYCAVAYYRLEYGQTFRLGLVQAKARVAPLKPSQTVPKLELQAMTVGSQLCEAIMRETDLIITRRHLFTDSEIALNWLKSVKRLTAFVASRVDKILEVTKLEEWHWVSGKTNIADWGTKRIPDLTLTPDSQWFKGMDFLQDPEDLWPDSSIPELKDEENLVLFQQELIDEEIIAIHEVQSMNRSCLIGELIKIERFSNFNRLIRATAYVLSFRDFLKTKSVSKSNKNKITLSHMREALKLWIQQAQYDEYGAEMIILETGGFVKKSSPLYNLSPIMVTGILRLKGREPHYRPIIMPPKHEFTKLLVQHYHIAFGHQGTNTILSSLRVKYWIPNSRPLIKLISKVCKVCKVQRATPPCPEMGYLPPERLIPGVFPFTYCGVDYFGPILVTIGRRVEKRWGSLFTCLSTRAVHVELVHSLSTSSMIMALNRFSSLRGTPKKMFSDNGTNFRGADNELKLFISRLKDDKIEEQLTIRDIDWSFIPPGGPHWGGCWERDVRSVKTALSAILKEHRPNEEVLATAICEAVNIVNNRPLTNISEDPKDLPPITPNDILLLRRNDNMMEMDFDPQDIDCRHLWKKAQWIADQFWRRWLKEYRPELVKRSKWYDNRRYYELKPGDVVVIVDETLKRGQWPKGVIEEVFPGRDGNVRVVTVRTPKATYKRPVTKVALICPAPEAVLDNKKS